MDPYLEREWSDVHGRLVPYVADALNGELPGRYRARLQKRVLVSDVDEPVTRAIFPDVAVVDRPGGATTTLSRTRHVLIQSPRVLQWSSDPLTQYTIEIVDAGSGNRVVTAVEVLSRENKRPGDGRNQYRQKQAEYREAGVNRVEVDLLRGGRRTFEFPESILPAELRKAYYVAIYRGDQAGQAEVFAIDVRDPLPAIGVPLRPGEADVPLALQPLLDRTYANGRFDINYDQPCDPPLAGEEAAWAASLPRT